MDKFRVNPKLTTSKLILTPKQKEELYHLLELKDLTSKDYFETKFWDDSDEQQEEANEFLTYHGLIQPLLESSTRRWKTRWSDKNDRYGKKILYQCACGTDKQNAFNKVAPDKRRKLRQIYEFVGCLAFVKLEFDETNTKYRRLHGYLDHSEACHRGIPKIEGPTLTINPLVKAMTELMVKANFSIKEIISINQHLMKNHLSSRIDLRGEHFLITLYDILDSRRSLLMSTKSEATSWKLDINKSVSYNLNQIYDENCSKDSEIYESTIYTTSKDQRKLYNQVEMVLATHKQLALAMEYGQNNYIILDGNFSTGNKKSQLYVIFVIDESGRGIPVGYLLYKKPTIHNDDHELEILKHLLLEYKNKLSLECKREFVPKVIIIGASLKEHLAVSSVWEHTNARVLYSAHIVHQCWLDKSNQLFGTDDDNIYQDKKNFINDELGKLLKGMSSENEVNRILFDIEQSANSDISTYRSDVKKLIILNGALEFVQYIRNDWMDINKMRFWAYSSRESIIHELKIPTTDAYLEGFKLLFKPTRFLRFQQRGNVLRMDTLCAILAKYISPLCEMQNQLWNYIKETLDKEKEPLQEYIDGNMLEEGQLRELLARNINTIAFQDINKYEDIEASRFIHNNCVDFIEFSLDKYLFVTIKTGQKNLEHVPGNPDMDYYVVQLLPEINCHCMRYLIWGGACSHIRAAIHSVNWVRDRPDIINGNKIEYFPNLEHRKIPYIQLSSHRESMI
ncbi:20495_t:CDS:2, partial [Entrophospora sp. SA101]